MAKAKILSLEQTETAGLFTIIFNGYVISLQKLDALLKADIRSGAVRIEKTEIIGTEEKDYEL